MTANHRVTFFIAGIFLLGFLLPVKIQAQYRFQVIKANGKPEVASPAGGMYYALPKTIFKIHVVLEKMTEIPGPFAQYTPQYLGSTHYIKTRKVYYRLLSVKVTPVTVADPHEVYYIRFPQDRSSKEKRSFGVQLNRQGIITGFGFQIASIEKPAPAAPAPASSQTYLFSDLRQGFEMQAGYSRAQKIDTIVHKITIDTVTIKRFLYKTNWVNLSEKDRANAAAKQIKNIRQSRFNLLTGYQEVNYGEGIRYMDAELQKLEKEYLALFLGREYKQMVVRTFVFDPEKQTLSEKLFQFAGKNGNQQTLSVRAKVVNPLKTVAEEKTTGPDALFYRIPAQAELSVGTAGAAPFYSDTFVVPQLGVISTVPVRETSQVLFNPQTGAVLKMERK